MKLPVLELLGKRLVIAALTTEDEIERGPPSVSVVNEFLDMFLKDLLSMLPNREIEF